MDQEEKIMVFRSLMGGGADEDVARQILMAHDWDVERALNTVMGDDTGLGQPAAPPPQASLPNDPERAPMRTGYFDTLAGPTTGRELRAERLMKEEAEADRKRLQAECAEEAERRRVEAEAAHVKSQEDTVAEMRREAERQAAERRRKRQDAEVAERRRLAEARCPPPPATMEATDAAAGSSKAEEPVPVPQPTTTSTTAAAATEEGATAGAATRPSEAEAPPPVLQPATASAAAADTAEEEGREAAAPVAEAATAAAEVSAAASSEDSVVTALVSLRRRYRDEDPSGLATCLATLRAYINNLARSPHETKFQRINAGNAAFRARVTAFEGATAVLEACGFREADGAWAVGPEFLKSKGSRLWDALAKIDVMLDQVSK